MKYRFLSFELDTERHELRNEGAQIAIPPKAFSVLHYLIEHRDRLVPKSELLDAFWSANVSEAALQTTISLVRKTLGSGSDQSVIKTHHGRGLRFVAQVTAVEAGSERSPGSPAHAAFTLREQRFAAVLCLRLEHSARLGKAAPNFDQAIDTFFDTARQQVEAHKGRLLHMMVDGFTAIFEIANANEDSARRAAHCALALAAPHCVAELSELGVGVAFAIDSGAVETGKMDNIGAAGEWAAPGSVERSATAMAALAPAGSVLLGDATVRQLGDEVQIEPSAQGSRLVAVGPLRAGVPARPRSTPSEFVGRAAEVAFLATSLEGLRDGNGQALVLSGPAGIGKSRLAAEFLLRVQSEPWATLKIHCLPSLVNTPLAPIREMCLALFTDLPGGLIEDEIDQALFDDLLHETASPSATLSALSDQVRKERVFALLDRLLAHVCEKRALVLVVEDVHWIDATSGEYLDALVTKVSDFAVMLVMTTRPAQGRLLAEAVLQLPPLSSSESLAMLLAIPEFEGIAKGEAEEFVGRAAGNPFFLEELALAAQTDTQGARNLPDTVQAVISVRVAALDADARAALYVVAVIGSSAPVPLIAHLLGDAVENVNDTLERLVLTGFIVRDAKGYTFRHMLIHDTAYVMIAEADRRQLHKAISEYLVGEHSVKKPRPELLAFHQQEAGDTAEAIASWTLACAAALNRCTFREAIAFANSGLALIGPDDAAAARSELDLQLAMALARSSLEGYASAGVGEAFYRAQHLNGMAGTPETTVRVNVGLWIHTWVCGELEDSLGYASNLIAMAKQARSSALSLQAHASMGEVLLHTGRVSEALEHLESGCTFIEGKTPGSIPSQNAAVACAAYTAWAASLSGNSALASTFYEMSAALSEALENPFALALHLGLCAEYCLFEGDVDSCLALATKGVAISRQYDFAFWLGTALVLQGWALAHKGEHTDAQTALNEGIDVFEATGAGVQLANWYGLKAEALLLAGEIEQGVQAAEHALACADRTNDRFFAPRIHAVGALLYERQGEHKRAKHSAGAATALALEFGISERFITLLKPS